MVLAVKGEQDTELEITQKQNSSKAGWRIELPYFYIESEGGGVLTVKDFAEGVTDSRQGSMLTVEEKSDDANQLWSWNSGLLVNQLSGLASVSYTHLTLPTNREV